jgi:ribosomal protein S18
MALNLLLFRVEADTTYYNKILQWISYNEPKILEGYTTEAGRVPHKDGII